MKMDRRQRETRKMHRERDRKDYTERAIKTEMKRRERRGWNRKSQESNKRQHYTISDAMVVLKRCVVAWKCVCGSRVSK